MTNAEFVQRVIKSLQDGSADIQTDNSGQLIVYSQLFEHNDGTIHETVDPHYNDD